MNNDTERLNWLDSQKSFEIIYASEGNWKVRGSTIQQIPIFRNIREIIDYSIKHTKINGDS